jgi:hypothetical protein
MDKPEVVRDALGEEAVAATVSLGGSDRLFVTPTRTLVYRAEGLLSDESVEEYPHGAERIELSAGRRKSKLRLDYGLDGERTLALPAKHVDDALHPMLAGTLNAAEVTDPGETVKETFRFSELTLLVTSARVVKHVGTAVWDQEYEEFHYDDVTDLTFEEGSVATSVVLTLGDSQERFKAPNDAARRVREAIQDALFAHHGVQSVEELRTVTRPEDGEGEEAAGAGAEEVAFGDGPGKLNANPPHVAPGDETGAAGGDGAAVAAGDADRATGSESGFEESGFEPASDADEGADVDGDADGDVAAELAELRAAVEEQNERLARHEELVEQLIEELRQGR